MHTTRKVTDDLYYIGCNDRKLERFENLFTLPNGVSYNSYLIMDEKVALTDTIDADVTDQFIENINYVLNGRNIDYLIIHHMEPDHGANIKRLMDLYPDMTLVGNVKTKKMVDQFFDFDCEDCIQIVKEGDSLNLGSHTLTFYMAPMVHWPEVMVSYDEKDKVLFSADGFGTFGALDGGIFNDEANFEEKYLDEARRYYGNIVGKYGMQTANLLKKAAGLDIQMICPLHGPIWRSDLSYFLEKYDRWSTYTPETEGVLILCGSVYGHTMAAAEKIALKLKEKGVKEVVLYDVSKTEVSYLIAEIFKYSHLIFACATYNNGIFPKMADLLHDMKALALQKRTVGIVQNGTWAPASGKLIREELESMKDMKIVDKQVNILSALKAAQESEVDDFVSAFTESMK
ncbi:flavorubredoxin [Aequitasia blattaphilus]|uniref:FprA family A-type flavoprotein n=1 Tax=Aequitasia blattaphilus TaxID=2949332 RepID=A0ABT1E7Z8_9FIRM|nr:FprA family A-type flavoprotein [Aequitasia blattaphilus]MCP1101953.1 FprA family A-type flavoprotein [Aequitasia blattaphilus]MCR8614593.1 FprA family A-type flavoprotein [Aequitasia blattaphilus]